MDSMFTDDGGMPDHAAALTRDRIDAILTTLWASMMGEESVYGFEDFVIEWLLVWNTKCAVESSTNAANDKFNDETQAFEAKEKERSAAIAEIMRTALVQIRDLNRKMEEHENANL